MNNNLNLTVSRGSYSEFFTRFHGLFVRLKEFEPFLDIGRAHGYIIYLLRRFNNIFGQLPVRENLYFFKRKKIKLSPLQFLFETRLKKKSEQVSFFNERKSCTYISGFFNVTTDLWSRDRGYLRCFGSVCIQL